MDPLLAARIRGQSGLVTRDQARAAGLTEKAIRWRLESGRWLRLHPGVYLTEPGRDDWSMHAVAALLNVGPPVALWGRSAGHAWSLLTDTGDTISVVVPFARSGRPRDGIRVIRSRHMRDRVDPSAWPHRTTAEDTVLDLSQGRSLDRAVALVSKARQLHLVTPASLLRALDHRPGQSHRSLLREALDEIGAGVESAAEYRYVRDVERAHGLPEGRRQDPAPGQRHRDSFYDLVDVVVEIDGRVGHEGWAAQKRDRRRDLDAAVNGHLTIRPTWVDVAQAPCALATDLVAIFRQRGWNGRARSCRRHGCPVAALNTD